MRRWSVFLWPVVLAAMSESTRSAGPPINSLRRSGASGARKSSTSKVTPASGSIGKRSMPTIWPLPFATPTFSAATCAQPPGAAPRSRMRWPLFKMR